MVIGIIPARYGSTRLPGKMLADIGGKPLLWHTWTRAKSATRLDRLVIAAGDERIADAAREFGAEVVEIFDDVPSGSDRVYRAARKLEFLTDGCGLQIDDTRANIKKSAVATGKPEIVLNIQGDEPQIDPRTIDAVVDALLADPEAGVGTAVAPITTESEYLESSIVKVVLDAHNRAIYFSRSPIPYGINLKSEILKSYRHMGLYAYRYAVLEQFTRLPVSPLEMTERLEQLRLLEQGVKFAVAVVPRAGQEVNTAEDLERVRGSQNENRKE